MPILLLFLLLLRLVLWPIIKILSHFGPLKKRYQFEQRNLTDPQCVSFYETHEKADILFHFSSEGEFEQVRPLIEEMFERGHKIELLFTSESVEAKVLSLVASFDDKVRYLRVPLVDFFPFLLGQNILHWATAKKMVMVRYDFFPELLTLGMRLSRFVLYSASMKSKTNSGISWTIKKMIYESFSDVFCATQSDYNFFSKVLDRVNVHQALDLRSIQIKKRQNNFHKLKNASELKELFELAPIENRVCFAQLWPIEAQLFADDSLRDKIISGELLAVVAPHKLNDEFITQLKAAISQAGKKIEIYFLPKSASQEQISSVIKLYKETPGLIITAIPGILCESYTYFNEIYIGGGHGKGVHSLLEPFIAGARLFCGPGVHRSTEYDIVLAQKGSITIVDKLEDFHAQYMKNKKVSENSNEISEFINHNELEMNKLIKILDNHNA